MRDGVAEGGLGSHREMALGGSLLGGDSLARRTHGQSCCGQLHVQRGGELQGLQFLQLFVQPSILIRQSLAASLQQLTIDLRLLQLGPVNSGKKES